MSGKRYAKLKGLAMTLKDKKREEPIEKIKLLQKRIAEFDMLDSQREWAYDRTSSIVRVTVKDIKKDILEIIRFGEDREYSETGFLKYAIVFSRLRETREERRSSWIARRRNHRYFPAVIS